MEIGLQVSELPRQLVDPVWLLTEHIEHERPVQAFEYDTRALLDAHKVEHIGCRRASSACGAGARGFSLGGLDRGTFPVQLHDSIVLPGEQLGRASHSEARPKVNGKGHAKGVNPKQHTHPWRSFYASAWRKA